MHYLHANFAVIIDKRDQLKNACNTLHAINAPNIFFN